MLGFSFLKYPFRWVGLGFLLVSTGLGLDLWITIGHAEDVPLNKYTQMEHLNHRGIWDGNLTQAESGLFWELWDEGRSDGKEGIRDFRHYLIPVYEDLNIMHEDVSREKRTDLGKIQSYSEDALVQIPFDSVIRNQPLKKGYYLAHLGDFYSGSTTHNLGYDQEEIPPDVLKQRKREESYSAIILEQFGKVMGAFPIEHREPYLRQKGQKKSGKPFAYIDISSTDPDHPGPALKIHYKHWIYTVFVEPQQRPVSYPGALLSQ